MSIEHRPQPLRRMIDASHLCPAAYQLATPESTVETIRCTRIINHTGKHQGYESSRLSTSRFIPPNTLTTYRWVWDRSVALGEPVACGYSHTCRQCLHGTHPPEFHKNRLCTGCGINFTTGRYREATGDEALCFDCHVEVKHFFSQITR